MNLPTSRSSWRSVAAVAALLVACRAQVEAEPRADGGDPPGAGSAGGAHSGGSGSAGARPTGGGPAATGGAASGGNATATGGGASGGGAGGAGAGMHCTSNGGGRLGDGGPVINYERLDTETCDIVSEMPPGGTLLGESGSPDWKYKNDESTYEVGFLPGWRDGTRAARSCETCTEAEVCLQTGRSSSYFTCHRDYLAEGFPAAPVVCNPAVRACYSDCPGACGCDGRLYCNACIAAAWGVDTAQYRNECAEYRESRPPPAAGWFP